jgi:hypothetical protein
MQPAPTTQAKVQPDFPDPDRPRPTRSSRDEPGEPGDGPAMPAVPGGADLGPAPRPTTNQPQQTPIARTRDWTIAIDCLGDSVTLPTGQKLPIAGWPAGASRDHPLLLAVQDLIRRRQAAGVSDRPQVRFRVYPDGLRAYYQAFPALESLQLLMNRENVDPAVDEDRE